MFVCVYLCARACMCACVSFPSRRTKVSRIMIFISTQGLRPVSAAHASCKQVCECECERVCVCLCLCVCARACVRACVRARMRACAHAACKEVCVDGCGWVCRAAQAAGKHLTKKARAHLHLTKTLKIKIKESRKSRETPNSKRENVKSLTYLQLPLNGS